MHNKKTLESGFFKMRNKTNMPTIISSIKQCMKDLHSENAINS